MTVEERRQQAFGRLVSAIGDEATETVFEMISEAGSAASSRDVLAVRDEVSALRAESAAFRGESHERFREMDQRFAGVDQRFEAMDRRFADVDRRFDIVDHRFDQVDRKVESLGHELTAAFHDGLNRAVVGQTRIIVFSLLTAFVAVAALMLGTT